MNEKEHEIISERLMKIFDLLCQAEKNVIYDYISKFASCEKNDDGYYIWKMSE